MSGLTSGMLWLVKPDEKMEKRLGDAVEYAEEKYGKPIKLIACPPGESYPHLFGTIPVRPSKLIMANHIYLVTETNEAESGQVGPDEKRD